MRSSPPDRPRRGRASEPPKRRPGAARHCISAAFDRNNNHTLLLPNRTHVPSVLQQSALAAGVIQPTLPAAIDPHQELPAQSAGSAAIAQRVSVGTEAAASVAAINGAAALLESVHAEARSQDPTVTRPSATASRALTTILQAAGVSGGLAGTRWRLTTDPASYGVISHLLTEAQAAAEARALWFWLLAPQTRYTLDVVACLLWPRPDPATTRTARLRPSSASPTPWAP